MVLDKWWSFGDLEESPAIRSRPRAKQGLWYKSATKTSIYIRSPSTQHLDCPHDAEVRRLIFLLGTKHNLCLMGWERYVMLILPFVGIFYQLWLYAEEVTIVTMHWWWWWLSLTMQWVFWEQCSITQHVQTCLSSLIDRTNDYWSMCSGSYWSRGWGWFWYWFSEGIWTWKDTAYIYIYKCHLLRSGLMRYDWRSQEGKFE